MYIVLVIILYSIWDIRRVIPLNNVKCLHTLLSSSARSMCMGTHDEVLEYCKTGPKFVEVLQHGLRKLK